MNDVMYDVLVVGGGHAGLGASYYLKKLNLSHLVFEQARIGNSWSSMRWDSFKLNTPLKMSTLPGLDVKNQDLEGFLLNREFVSILEEYVWKYELPVRENSQVLKVERASDPDVFSMTVSTNGKTEKYQCKQVVIASGACSRELVPGISKGVSPDIVQMHAGEYRHAGVLPEGAVLVVGSGQSGVQITEDLLDSEKEVFLSTSKVARVPRRYRGKDVMDWLQMTGFMDQRIEEVDDPKVLAMKQPQISGIGQRGKTVSLQSLAARGAVILGKAISIEEDLVSLQPNAAAHIKFGDGFSQMVKGMIEEYIGKAQIDAPAPELDPNDVPDEHASYASGETSLNLKEKGITAIIWSTGFTGDFSYIKLPVFDEYGQPVHRGGVTDVRGLYFLGLPWLRKRKSALIYGIEEDAEYICRKIKTLSEGRNLRRTSEQKSTSH